MHKQVNEMTYIQHNYHAHQRDETSHTCNYEIPRKQRGGKRRGVSRQFKRLLSHITATDVSLYVALDCEMVGVGKDGLNSALARVTILDFDESTVILDVYVRVDEPVVDYRTHVSGITKLDLEKGMDAREVHFLVASLLKKRILVGHALENDLRILGISHPPNDIRDTSTYPKFMRHDRRRRRLKDLVHEHLGVQIQEGSHCSKEDAKAALRLFKLVRMEWESSLYLKNYQQFKEKVNFARYVYPSLHEFHMQQNINNTVPTALPFGVQSLNRYAPLHDIRYRMMAINQTSKSYTISSQ